MTTRERAIEAVHALVPHWSTAPIGRAVDALTAHITSSLGEGKTQTSGPEPTPRTAQAPTGAERPADSGHVPDAHSAPQRVPEDCGTNQSSVPPHGDVRTEDPRAREVATRADGGTGPCESPTSGNCDQRRDSRRDGTSTDALRLARRQLETLRKMRELVPTYTNPASSTSPADAEAMGRPDREALGHIAHSVWCGERVAEEAWNRVGEVLYAMGRKDAERRLAEWFPHKDHGRASVEETPNLTHCPCVGTPKERECSDTGCGYCNISMRPKTKRGPYSAMVARAESAEAECSARRAAEARLGEALMAAERERDEYRDELQNATGRLAADDHIRREHQAMIQSLTFDKLGAERERDTAMARVRKLTEYLDDVRNGWEQAAERVRELEAELSAEREAHKHAP